MSESGFSTRTRVAEGETIDGEQRLTTVIGERVGRENRRILVVASRDAAAPDSPAELSATAALSELAQLFEGRATRRTLTLVSTSGSAGLAGVRDLAQQLPGPVDAAIVLGDLAGDRVDHPVVVPWSEDGAMAPLRLRRTVERAVELEARVASRSPRAVAQFARLAVPLTLTGQGPLGRAGVSAVTLQASGERGPSATTPVDGRRLEDFGRGALRAISALDNGPDVPAGPRPYIVFRGQVVPEWAVALLGGTLLFPALLAGVDGLARVRRRRIAVVPWLRWIAVGALPFLLAALLARLLGLTGLIPAPAGPVDPEALPVDYVALGALVLALVLGFLVRPFAARALGGRGRPDAAQPGGAAAAVVLVPTAIAIAVWATNPYTALLLVPAVHLWMLATAPEVRVPRAFGLLLVLAGLLPFVLVGLYYAGEFGLHPAEVAWEAALLVTGGYAGPLGVAVWSVVLSSAIVAGGVALRRRREDPPVDRPPSPTTRGPMSYAGPGSLGGTESALRR